MTNPDVIHLLPDSVANQIAAGEVIQRPASVVKELVENSVDAGATEIKIVIKDAGRTLIQVIDNGCGMSVTDARMAFERHATSKISQAADLFTLHTMGFRGEALPSIAAVSEIEMRSMRRGDTAGTKLMISASRVTSQEPEICSAGTNIMVKRIFFNLPARRKFLKKDPVELGHIVREFERLALVNTNVEFTLAHNDVIIHKLPAGTLKQRICALFGKGLDHQIIPVTTETSLVRIDGFISLPMHARRRGALQYFFVNGRYMRHPYFHKAVLSSFENLIPVDSQPSYFINFNVDPETIDVNIHPQKYEIKFENEQPVWQILQAAIKESLGRFNASAAIDFDVVDAPDIPAFSPADLPMPDSAEDSRYDPFKAERIAQRQATSPSTYSKPSVPTDWEKLYQNFNERQGETIRQSRLNVTPDLDFPDEPAAPPVLMDTQEERLGMLQLKGRYIVTPSKSGLMLIDQHRAHIRVLFDRYMEIAQHGQVPSQRLIFPETVSLDATQSIVATSIAELLSTMGFEIKALGEGEWQVDAVPSMIGNVSVATALLNIIDSVSQADDDVQQSQWQRIILSLARSAAIKYGTPLTDKEMDQLVADLLRLPQPDYTPDGKAVIQLLELDSINRLFA
ncbi:MAG: DNA mismatch repair endonuclease MutL [Bacteroidales bacterium]|nr:DNA mismatch repair endonuclease MutL [Bacteroidales bacterium]